MNGPKDRREKDGPQRRTDEAGVEQVNSKIPSGPDEHGDNAPGEFLEGEGAPGLTISGLTWLSGPFWPTFCIPLSANAQTMRRSLTLSRLIWVSLE